MPRTGTLLLIALAVGNTGCLGPGNGAGNGPGSSFLRGATRNFIETPIVLVDDLYVAYRDKHRAKDAWEEVRREHPDLNYSKDYGLGFKEGFADYLDAGGNGQPPAVPPFRYRLAHYQTPQGYAAIQDWYAGFRHGAAVARTTGFRDTIVIPISDPPINAPHPRVPFVSETFVQPPPPEPVPESKPMPPPVELNPPRRMMPPSQTSYLEPLLREFHEPFPEFATLRYW